MMIRCRSFNRSIGYLAGLLIIVTLLQLGSAQAVLASRNSVTPHVFPPNSSPYGHTYGEWSTLFWQSLLAGPFDPEACSIGQSDNVLFLSATAGGPGEFACDVPVGTSFLISVLSGAFWCPDDCQPSACAPGGTIPELRECAGSAFDLGVVLECDIDGVAIDNLLDYRAQSPIFSGDIGPSNPFGIPPHAYGPAVADGVWVMVGPLRVGPHVIHFHAVIGDPGSPIFETESTHHITVVPGHAREEGAPVVESATWGAIKATYR